MYTRPDYVTFFAMWKLSFMADINVDLCKKWQKKNGQYELQTGQSGQCVLLSEQMNKGIVLMCLSSIYSSSLTYNAF